jgi:hypothetical protein
MTPDEQERLIENLCHSSAMMLKHGCPASTIYIRDAIARIRATANHNEAIEALGLLVGAKDIKDRISLDSGATWAEEHNRYTDMRCRGWAKARLVLAAIQTKETDDDAG